MAKELAYVLINPYTIAKSRTGGVIARYVGRTDLSLVAARMFGPGSDLVAEYAALVRSAAKDPSDTANLIADYIAKSYGPSPATGRPRRVMMLLFEGEDAVRKIWDVTGSATARSVSGQTIRDTYGDYILTDEGRVQYFEPAVLVAPSKERAGATMRLWARYSDKYGGMMQQATDVPKGADVQLTLVMLKPDNFRFPSLRPGNIIDILSSSGLRIVAVKKFAMTVAQAMEFYAPVRDRLREKFPELGGQRAAEVLSREFGFAIPSDAAQDICRHVATLFADHQFASIVEFMTGASPTLAGDCNQPVSGSEGCLAIVYEGIRAVETIRSILGATDPSKAKPGSVRREFGSNILVNAAHASDSPENAMREIGIIRVEEDTIRPLVEAYYGVVTRA